MSAEKIKTRLICKIGDKGYRAVVSDNGSSKEEYFKEWSDFEKFYMTNYRGRIGRIEVIGWMSEIEEIAKSAKNLADRASKCQASLRASCSGCMNDC